MPPPAPAPSNRPHQPQEPHTRPVQEALTASPTLTQLLARLGEAKARLDSIQAVLPPGLRAHVRSGVLDDTGWNLLVPNGAVAAKLRQCLPAIEQALAERGWKPTSVRVKVQSERA